MTDTWIISDTHFRHADILKFKDYAGKIVRQFDNVNQMDECMFDNWNSVVKPNDTVYHLGDVVMGEDKPTWLKENMHKLKGKKHLVLGNHDNPKFLAPYFKSILFWADMTKKHGLLLSHIPLHLSTLQESHRFGDYPVKNIHGHIHSNPSPEGPYRCVSVEHINYTPINLEELK